MIGANLTRPDLELGLLEGQMPRVYVKPKKQSLVENCSIIDKEG